MRLHRGDPGSHGPRHGEIPVCTTRSPAPSLFLTTRRLKEGSGDVPAKTRSRGPPGRHPHRLGHPSGSVPPRRRDWRLTEAGSVPENGCPAAPRRPLPPRQRATVAFDSHKPLQRRNPTMPFDGRPFKPIRAQRWGLSAQSTFFFNLKEVRSRSPSAQWERWKFPERTGPMGAASEATIGGPSSQSLSQKCAPPSNRGAWGGRGL